MFVRQCRSQWFVKYRLNIHETMVSTFENSFLRKKNKFLHDVEEATLQADLLLEF